MTNQSQQLLRELEANEKRELQRLEELICGEIKLSPQARELEIKWSKSRLEDNKARQWETIANGEQIPLCFSSDAARWEY